MAKQPSKAKRDKAKKIWQEFESGTLNMGKSNMMVHSKAQAQAIMLSTLGIEKKPKKSKKK